jgi:hypothetical protein
VKPYMTQFANGVEECLTPIGLWLNDNAPKQAVVVTPDAGVIGYWSERKICDLAGLITPEMEHLRRRGLSYDEVMTKRLFLSICYPEYVVDRASTPERLADEQFVPVMTKRFGVLGLSTPETQFYTLYKVNASIIPKSQLTHSIGKP